MTAGEYLLPSTGQPLRQESPAGPGKITRGAALAQPVQLAMTLRQGMEDGHDLHYRSPS